MMRDIVKTAYEVENDTKPLALALIAAAEEQGATVRKFEAACHMAMEIIAEQQKISMGYIQETAQR